MDKIVVEGGSRLVGEIKISGAKNGAYRYLHDSVMAFPERDAFLGLMREAGLARPRTRLLTGGVAAIYRGEVEAG